jgi:hypothetical protein
MLHAEAAPRLRGAPVGALSSRDFHQGERPEARPACRSSGRDGGSGDLAGSSGIVSHARRLCTLADPGAAAAREIVRRQPRLWRKTGLAGLPRTVRSARSRADGGFHVAAVVRSFQTPVLRDGRRFRRADARFAGEVRRLRRQCARKRRPQAAALAQGEHDGGAAAPRDLVTEAFEAWGAMAPRLRLCPPCQSSSGQARSRGCGRGSSCADLQLATHVVRSTTESSIATSSASAAATSCPRSATISRRRAPVSSSVSIVRLA